MTLLLAAALLAGTADPAPPAAPVPQVAENWAAPVAPAQAVIRSAVRETIAEQHKKDEEDASAHRYDTYYGARQRPDKYQTFEIMFADAKVPGCLQPDGLKRQTTLIFGGLLALPFIAVAKLRGKCN